MKTQNKNLDDETINKILNDDGQQVAWESGELGKDPKHAKAVYIKSAKGLPTSMRIPESLIAALKKLAEDSGIPYQTYIKMILTRHVKEKQRNEAA